MKLSNSAIDLYKLCPMKYKLHYLERIRSEETGSALIFGGAIDEALNVLLLKKKKSHTAEEAALAKEHPYSVFLRKWRNTTIIDKETYVPTSENVYYYKGDCDLSVLTDEDKARILRSATKEGYDVDSLDAFCESVGKIKDLSDKDRKLYHYVAWNCLAKKGLMFIDAYVEQVMPRIKEVHSIQREVHLPNANGNYINGYIDFEATMDDGVRYVIDNKTSSAPYKADSVQSSQQLTIYGEYCENFHCAYIVLNKRLRKNEPRVRIQIILDNIEEEQIGAVFDKIGEVEANIENKEFENNWDGCFSFGRLCEFYKYCRDGSVDGLQCVKKKKGVR